MECSRRRAVSSVSASGTRRAARASSRRAAQLLASRRTHLHAHAPRVRSGYSSDCCPTVETCSGCTLCRTSLKALRSTDSATVAFGLVESCAVRLLGAGGRFAVRMCGLQRARSQGAAAPMCSVPLADWMQRVRRGTCNVRCDTWRTRRRRDAHVGLFVVAPAVAAMGCLSPVVCALCGRRARS